MRLGFLKMLFPVIILLVNIDVQGQSTLFIVSKDNNQPLPYASVVNHTYHQLLFSNENGKVEHEFKAGDSISISYVGYRNQSFIFNGKEILSIKLSMQPSKLTEITLHACKKWEKQSYTNLEGDSSGMTFGGLRWIENSLNAKVAILLTSADTKSYLTDFSFWLQKSDFGNPSSFKAPIKFSFYELNDSTGLPGNLISAKQIIYQPKKTGKQTINADSLSIKMPEKGMYLCFEIPFDKKFTQRVKILTDDNRDGMVHYFYGGRLEGIYSKKNVLSFFDYLQNNWHFAINSTKEDMYKTHGTIKFAYTMKTCAE